MASKIGIVLALDGERQFTQGMKNAQQSAKILKTGLTELASEYKGNANSLEYLTQRQDKLKAQQEALNRVLTAAKTGQSEAKKQYKEQADALEQLRSKVQAAERSLSSMSKEDPNYDKQAKELAQLNEALDKQTANYLKAEARLSKWDSEVDKASKEVDQNSAALKKNDKYIDEASKSSDKCAKSIDKMGKEAKETAEETDKAGSSLKEMATIAAGNLAADALEKLGDAAVEAAKYVVEVGSEFEASMSKVEALSGASGAQLDAMAAKAKELGSSTKFSATNVADAFSYMALA